MKTPKDGTFDLCLDMASREKWPERARPYRFNRRPLQSFRPANKKLYIEIIAGLSGYVSSQQNSQPVSLFLRAARNVSRRAFPRLADCALRAFFFCFRDASVACDCAATEFCNELAAGDGGPGSSNSSLFCWM